MADDLLVTAGLTIPGAELVYRASRSSGPGGQHVNKTSTRIELVWDVAASQALTEEQRARLFARLSTRLDTAGQIRLTSSGTRSQLRNREEVTARLRTIVTQGLAVPRIRKKTRPTRAAKEKRLKAKQQRSETKRSRGRVRFDD